MSGVRPCCLVAEDQALLGLALEAYLDEAGFEVAGPFTGNADAVRWLERSQPEFAIVDVVLKDGPCLKLAKELKNLGVPFAIYSGLPKAEPLPPELQDVPWLEKPASRETLVQVLSAMTTANKVPAE
jgi:DNA-binding response OmpR family regulator